jgi:effector-binding domain-containing protein
MHTAEVETRTFAAQPTAVRRAALRPSEITDWLPKALGDIAETLRERHLVPNGFPFSRRRATLNGLVVVEAGFPLALPVTTDGSVQAAVLPAGPVAVTAYTGSYAKIGTAYELIDDWLRRRDGIATDTAWEVYHSPPIGSPDGWHTEIVQPYSVA